MGCNGGSAETSCIMPTGLLPDREICVGRVIDSERWLEAEKRVAELIDHIQPNEGSGKRMKDIADYVQSLISKCFPCQVFIFGSVPLMTYLPDGDIDLTIFSDNEKLKDSWTYKVYRVMKDDENNENAEFHVKEVQLIMAQVKVIKCLVDGTVVDITFHQTSGLRALCFLQEMDHLINQDHLLKRSIILIKSWCYYESRILGAHRGLISTYALETMIIYIFHVFDNSFSGPLEVLYRFLEIFSNFDWENFCVSIWGPVSVHLLPEVAVMPPRKENGEFYYKKFFLESCRMFINSLTCDQHCQRRYFVSKYLNVVDPLCVHNNLGRSVYQGNFYRICSAFVFGAEKLARLLDFPKEEMISELSQFFKNTRERHRADLHNSSTTRMAHLNPYKSIQVGASYPSRNISYKKQKENISEDPGGEHMADVGLTLYGASCQILKILHQKSENINGIQTAVCNAKKEEDYSNDTISKNQDYVEKIFDSAKPVRTNKNHENLNSNYSNNIEGGDCKLQGQLGMFCSANKNEAVTCSGDDSPSSKQSSSLQSTLSNGASHRFHDSTFPTIETLLSKTHPQVGNYEVPINETSRMSDGDHIIATGPLLPSNSHQREIANSGVVPSTLYPTGPPVPFLEILQTYNCPTHRSYYDGLYGLFDDETINFDRNVDQPEIHVGAPAMPIISHGLPTPNIPLLRPSPNPCPTAAPNMYFRRVFTPIRPIRSIRSQGSQFVPVTHVFPEAQIRNSDKLTFGDGIRTCQTNPRVVLSDQSPTTVHNYNCYHYGGNLDKGQQNCINRSPQAFWFTNEPNHSEKPSSLAGCLNPNYCQTNGSSSSSHVSTYVTQGMDHSQLFTDRSSSSQHKRLLVQNKHHLKEEGLPPP